MDSKKEKSSCLSKILSNCDFIHEKELVPILYECGIIHIIYLFSCLYLFGFIKGAIIGLAFYYAFYFIMNYFGYEMIKGIDVISTLEIHSHLKRNCTGYLKIGKIKTEELRDKYFVNLGAKKVRRLRQIWVRKFGFWFLKDVDPELTRGLVKRIDAEIHTDKDIFEYQAKLTSNEFDMRKPLWEVHVIENYDENTSVIFIVVHHLIADGMGILSLITFMNDNHNPDNIQQFREIPFFYYYILPLIYIPYGLFRFSYDAIVRKGDANMYPFALKTGKQSMVKEYHESKCFDLSELKKCYQHFDKMKLNDLVFASISAAFSRHFVELGLPQDKQTHFSCSIPVNMKSQPRCLEEVEFCNSCSLCVAKIPLSTDIEYVMKKNREIFDPGFSFTALRFGVWVVSFIGILPELLARLITRDNSKRLNIIISNTPGPQTPIYFCDQKVFDVGCIGPNVGCSGITVLISSYCGKVKIQMLTDSNLSMNPKTVLKYLEEQLDSSIKKYATS